MIIPARPKELTIEHAAALIRLSYEDELTSHVRDQMRYIATLLRDQLDWAHAQLLSRPQPSELGAEALAKAWDEGYHAARYDSPARGHASNPYRSKP